MMGYNPRAIPSVFPKTSVPSVEQRLDNLQKVREEAQAAHELARQRMAERITRGFSPFKKGQKVWLEAKNLRFLSDHKKLAMKRQGPFEIIEVLGVTTERRVRIRDTYETSRSADECLCSESGARLDGQGWRQEVY